MDRLAALQRYEVTPYVVFDGGPLPMKRGTEEERRKLRQKNRELGIEHYDNKRFREARKCFIRAADVSPYMAHQIIQVRVSEAALLKRFFMLSWKCCVFSDVIHVHSI